MFATKQDHGPRATDYGPDQFSAASFSVHVRAELADLARAPRLCLAVIRRRSFDVGKTRAYLPRLSLFARASGLQRSEVSRGLADLKAIRAITERPCGWYGINVLFDNWRVNWPKLTSDWEQLWLGLEEPPDLDEALRVSFVEDGGEGMSPAAEGVPPAGAGVRTAGGTVPEWRGEKQERWENPNVGKIPTTAVSTAACAGPVGVVGKIPTVGGAAAISPHTPLVQRTTGITGLDELQAFRERGYGGKPNAAARVTWAEQRRLEGLLRAWVGDEDMQRSRAFWTGKVIRNFPEELEEALAEARELVQTRREFFQGQQHRIKWLVVRTAKLARVEWGRVKAGKEPGR